MRLGLPPSLLIFYFLFFFFATDGGRVVLAARFPSAFVCLYIYIHTVCGVLYYDFFACTQRSLVVVDGRAFGPTCVGICVAYDMAGGEEERGRHRRWWCLAGCISNGAPPRRQNATSKKKVYV